MAVALRGHVRLRHIFGKSFGLYGRHRFAFTFLAAIAMSPFFLIVWAVRPFLLVWPAGPGWANWTVVGMMLVCLLLANGAITYGVVRDLQGRPAPTLEILDVLAHRLLPMIGVAILVTLLAFLGLLLGKIVLDLIESFHPFSSALPASTAIALCIFFVLSIFFAAIPVCVAEQPGIGKSLWRSGYLTKGYRWQIFATYLLIFVPLTAVIAPMSSANAGAMDRANDFHSLPVCRDRGLLL
jgi:hypothetical protein